MRGIVHGFGAALSLFTRIPGLRLDAVDRRTAQLAVRAFPWVGLLLGLGAGLLAVGFVLAGAGELLAVVLFLGALALVTGGFHLDGVADTADGLGSHREPAEALQIMKRSDIGPMGVMALVFVLALDVGALLGLAGQLPGWRWVAVAALGPVVGRLSTVAATGSWVPNARPGGLGSLVQGVTGPTGLAVNALAVALLCGGLGWWLGGPLVAASLLLALGAAALVWTLVTSRFQSRLGGLTGDCFGALIEWSQAAFFVAAALAVPLLARLG